MDGDAHGGSLRGQLALADEPLSEDELRAQLLAQREAREDADDQQLRDEGWDW